MAPRKVELNSEKIVTALSGALLITGELTVDIEVLPAVCSPYEITRELNIDERVTAVFSSCNGRAGS